MIKGEFILRALYSNIAFQVSFRVWCPGQVFSYILVFIIFVQFWDKQFWGRMLGHGWNDLNIHYTERKNINKLIKKNINCSCVRGRFSSPGIFPVRLVKPGYIWKETAAKNVRAQCDDVQRLVWFGMIFTFHQRNYLILFHGKYFQGSLLFFCLLWLLGLVGGNISFNSVSSLWDMSCKDEKFCFVLLISNLKNSPCLCHVYRHPRESVLRNMSDLICLFSLPNCLCFSGRKCSKIHLFQTQMTKAYVWNITDFTVWGN